MAADDLSADRLRELLHYDTETGVFRWKLKTSNRSNRIKVGEPTGKKLSSFGYVRVGIDGVVYQAHRLAWLYVHGCWPSGQLDHINGCRSDNRISNLRDVPQTTNMQNIKVARKDNKCGLLGVSTNGKKWSARIHVDGVAKHLGTFETKELAHQAYIEAKRLFHSGCTI